ncbi:FkbM family methyltransferase [Zhengella mangrovi]|uniref:FkbM family methyltransferase n=1 Tax=Zhengella mangrovi TaxID=1982044 RepID=UPI000E08D920|nr:FkbM family methyltransferase [Zhengella mangrovi]
MTWTDYEADDGVGGIATAPFGTFAPNAWQRALIAAARGSFLHRGTFRRTMFRLIQGGAKNPVDIAFRDCAFRLHGQDNLIEYGILLHPAYNSRDIDFLLEGASGGDSFVDIGSNIGLYSLPMARRAGAGGKVVAIDANTQVCRQLAFNARASGLANVQVFAEGVSDHETRARLRRRNDDIAIVSIQEDDAGGIPVRRLASILDEAGVERIHGLKIDIEGHEDKALVPFFDTEPESRWPSRIVIETAGNGEDYPGCAAAFARCGYELAGRTRQNSLYRLKTRA